MGVDETVYFVPLGGGRYRATPLTGGAWNEAEQHISPTGGLVVHEVERALGGALAGQSLARLTLDILGTVPVGDVEVGVEVVRPGRTIQLVEATVVHAGRAVVRARVWYLQDADSGAVTGGVPGPLPAPAEVPCWDMTSVWPGGYIGSLDVRRRQVEPGRAFVWVDSDAALVAGEASSDLARFAMLLDTANGVSVREDPAAWLFPNVDLTLHLHRQPAPGPVGLDVTVAFGSGGHGVTSSVVHDVVGPVGRLAQSLTLRRR